MLLAISGSFALPHTAVTELLLPNEQLPNASQVKAAGTVCTRDAECATRRCQLAHVSPEPTTGTCMGLGKNDATRAMQEDSGSGDTEYDCRPFCYREKNADYLWSFKCAEWPLCSMCPECNEAPVGKPGADDKNATEAPSLGLYHDSCDSDLHCADGYYCSPSPLRAESGLCEGKKCWDECKDTSPTWQAGYCDFCSGQPCCRHNFGDDVEECVGKGHLLQHTCS